VLAIRVWKAPLSIFQGSFYGGLWDPPWIGDPDTIELQRGSLLADDIRRDLFDYSLVLLRVFIAVLGVVLWYRNRREQLFLWVAVFTVVPVPLEILRQLFLIEIPTASLVSSTSRSTCSSPSRSGTCSSGCSISTKTRIL